jgi:2'-5' RNA ligase
VARCFLAVWPSDSVLDTIAALPRPDEAGVRYTRRDQWHVTLRFLGDCDPEEVVEAMAGFDGSELQQPEPVATLGPQVARLGRFVVVVPVAGLDELAGEVRWRTAEVGEPPDPRPFAGHITVARLKRRPACGIAGTPVVASFPVTSVALVTSDLDPAGATYTTHTEFPLHPPIVRR